NIINNVAIYEGIKVRSHHYHAPRSSDRSIKGSRLCQALDVVLCITQLVRMTDRQRVAQHSFEAVLSVSAQTHSGIIDQSSLGKDDIAASWKFDRERRSDPLAIL